jgi:hypothetical protein
MEIEKGLPSAANDEENSAQKYTKITKRAEKPRKEYSGPERRVPFSAQRI